jgi:hypothetical protein
MHTVRRCAALAILAVSVSLAGCFERATTPEVTGAAGTRSAVEALMGGASVGSPTPEGLLRLISAAWTGLAPDGLRDYASLLCDSTGPATPAFHALNDPAVLHQWLIVENAPWVDPTDLAMERLLYQAIHYSYSQEWLIWSADRASPADQIDYRAGRATLYRSYRLEVVLPGTRTRHVISIGKATLQMIREGSRWQLRQWNDRVDPAVGLTSVDSDHYPLGWRRLYALQLGR